MAELEILVTPRASSESVGPVVEGRLRIRVTRPPSGGEANRAALRLVARALDVASGRLELVAGERSRRKLVRVVGMEAAELERRLRALPSD
ncbi:MAG TPA: DUF167 domain-containing protein [Candidatus Limnocylindria bacterium]|nr:DUF167 domain-containing protein [Candidatus Limnocylindria bacterium]